MENITTTITVTLTPDDIDAIVDTLIETVDIYNPWDTDFLVNLGEDISAYCGNSNYTIQAILDNPATARKLMKAVATRMGEKYNEQIHEAISAMR